MLILILQDGEKQNLFPLMRFTYKLPFTSGMILTIPLSHICFTVKRTLKWKIRFVCKYWPMSFPAKTEKKDHVYILWFPFPWFYCFYVNSPRTFQVMCLEAAAIQQSKSWENNEKCAGKIHIKALETWKWKQQICKSLNAEKKNCLPSTCIYVF